MNTNVKIITLADGVEACYIPSDRFKTSRISICAYLPLEAETVPAYSVLSLLLSGGCADYPQMRLLNSRLDALYGASAAVDCSKSGDMLQLCASIVFVDDRFLPETVFSDCAELLFKLIFEPAIDNGGFLEGNFERDKRIQLEYIDNEINDKRTYARNRCVELLCEGTPYGLSTLGEREKVEALTRKQVLDAWNTMLKTAQFRISVTANREHPEIFELFKSRLANISRQPCGSVDEKIKRHDEVVRFDERFPVAQGKLVMGFLSDICGCDKETYKMMVFADMFGGGPYSLLFTNVREKMSLCYYCAARAIRRKGILLVDSGVEFDNMDKTYTAVLDQLEMLKKGEFDDELLASSKLALIGAHKAAYDSQAVLDRWYSDRFFDDKVLSPAEVCELIDSVTREDVINVANSVQLDTVYRLLGKEGE